MLPPPAREHERSRQTAHHACVGPAPVLSDLALAPRHGTGALAFPPLPPASSVRPNTRGQNVIEPIDIRRVSGKAKSPLAFSPPDATQKCLSAREKAKGLSHLVALCRLATQYHKKRARHKGGPETRNRGIPLETLYNHTEAVCTPGWHRAIAETGEKQRRQTAFVWRLENAPKLQSTHARLFTGMGRYCRPCTVRG